MKCSFLLFAIFVFSSALSFAQDMTNAKLKCDISAGYLEEGRFVPIKMNCVKPLVKVSQYQGATEGFGPGRYVDQLQAYCSTPITKEGDLGISFSYNLETKEKRFYADIKHSPRQEVEVFGGGESFSLNFRNVPTEVDGFTAYCKIVRE